MIYNTVYTMLYIPYNTMLQCVVIFREFPDLPLRIKTLKDQLVNFHQLCQSQKTQNNLQLVTSVGTKLNHGEGVSKAVRVNLTRHTPHEVVLQRNTSVSFLLA